MTEKLTKIMNSEISKLSSGKQEAIRSVNWAAITEEISKYFSLTENQLNSFQTETGLVLVGFAEADEYTTNLETNAGITKIDSEKIAEEVLIKIFTPIAEKIEKFKNIELGMQVKEKMKSHDPKWDQRINFIVSGGDYSSFLDN